MAAASRGDDFWAAALRSMIASYEFSDDRRCAGIPRWTEGMERA